MRRSVKCYTIWNVNNCQRNIVGPDFRCPEGHESKSQVSAQKASEIYESQTAYRGDKMFALNALQVSNEKLAEEGYDLSNLEYSTLVPEQIMVALCMDLGIPFVATSAPGRGKTATLKSIADDLDMNLIAIQASSSDAIDIAGRPTNNTITLNTGNSFGKPIKALECVAPDWMAQWDDQRSNMLFFDEMDKAPVDVQNAILKLIDEKILNTGDKLPEGTLIAAAGNFTSDAGAEDFTTALLSRLVPIAWFDDKLADDEGALKDGLKVREEGRLSNYRMKFPALPAVNSEVFQDYIEKAKTARENYMTTLGGREYDLDTPDSNTAHDSYNSSSLSNFATDRGWEKAIKLLSYHDAIIEADPTSSYAKHASAVKTRILKGTIGMTRGAPFLATYLAQTSIPTPSAVLKNPSKMSALTPESRQIVKTGLEKQLQSDLNDLIERGHKASTPADKRDIGEKIIDTIKSHAAVGEFITNGDPDSIDALSFSSDTQKILRMQVPILMQTLGDTEVQERFNREIGSYAKFLFNIVTAR